MAEGYSQGPICSMLHGGCLQWFVDARKSVYRRNRAMSNLRLMELRNATEKVCRCTFQSIAKAVPSGAIGISGKRKCCLSIKLGRLEVGGGLPYH